MQRIEATGAASYESAAAIAAAFSMAVADFTLGDNEQSSASARRWIPGATTAVQLTAGTVVIFGAALAILFYDPASDERVEFDIGVIRDGQELDVFAPSPWSEFGPESEAFQVHISRDLEVHTRTEALGSGSIRLQVLVNQCESEHDERRLLSESEHISSIGTTTDLFSAQNLLFSM